MNNLSLRMSALIKGIGVLFVVCVIILPARVGAATNTYTWTDQTGSGSKMWKGIAGSSDLTKLAAVELTGGRIYTSTNSGVNWNQSNASVQSWLGIASSPDGTHLSAISNLSGNVYVSVDSGVNWSSAGAGARNWTAVAMASSTSIIAASAYGDYIFISTTTGSTWTPATNAGQRAWQALALSSDGSRIVAAVNPGGIYLSADGGTNWSLSSASSSAPWQSVASSANGTKLVAAMHSGYIYTSADSGANWATTSAPRAAWQTVTSSSDGTRLAAAIDSGDIYTSSDGGATWTDQTSAGSRIWFSIVSSTDGSKLAATAYNGDVWTGSTDLTPPAITLDPTFNHFHASANVFNLSSRATDDQGISSVQFYLNGASYGSSTESVGDPTIYYVSFDGTAQSEGTYQYFAVAKDSSGNYATSTPQTFYLIKTPAVISEVKPVPAVINGTTAVYYYSASYSTANDNSQIASIDQCVTGTQVTASSISPNTTSSITISGLTPGNTYTCTLFLQDAARENSNTLTFGPFTALPSTSGSGSSSGGSISTEDLVKLLAPSAATTAYLKSRGMTQIPKAVSGVVAIPVPTPAPATVLTATTSVPTAWNFATDLSFNMTDAEVIQLQKYLNTQGFAVALSGPGSPGNESDIFGFHTLLALKKFQAAHALPPTGNFGSVTRAFINGR